MIPFSSQTNDHWWFSFQAFGSLIQKNKGVTDHDPIRNATSNFSLSREATKIWSQGSALKSDQSLELNDHDGATLSVKIKKQEIHKFSKKTL